MRAIFFYGLFMDRALLAAKGLDPGFVRPAVLPDYRIHIGDRASLVPSAGDRAFGMLVELSEADARALYSEAGVREYVAEPVRVQMLDSDSVVEADCYNLPRELAADGANPAYAAELVALALALEFDPAYITEIAAFCAES